MNVTRIYTICYSVNTQSAMSRGGVLRLTSFSTGGERLIGILSLPRQDLGEERRGQA